jgi:hypothetical protein
MTTAEVVPVPLPRQRVAADQRPLISTLPRPWGAGSLCAEPQARPLRRAVNADSGRSSECDSGPVVGVLSITDRSVTAPRAQLQLTGSAQLNAATMIFPITKRSMTPLPRRTKSASHSAL